MSDMKRGGFIGMIAAACAVPSLTAEVKPAQRHLKRVLVLYNVNAVLHSEAHELGNCLAEMGLQGPIMGVELPCGDTIRLLNIDNIPPETVDSLVAKFKEYINA